MKIQTHTLKNGLPVVLIDTESFPTVTTLLLVGAGSRYENQKNNGIAHFLEHMFYKGSTKYPTSFVISSTIEGMGGIWNAFTSKDHTGYWIKATNEHFETSLDVLSDIILNPLLLQEEIKKEKGVIVEELNMYEDTPARKVGELFESLLYKGSPLGYEIGGTKDTVTSFDRKVFTDYLGKLYSPTNAVLVISGGLDKGYSYLKSVEQKFGKWKENKTETFVKAKETQIKPEIIVRNKTSEQAHLCIGYRTFSFFDQRKYILSVLTTILGGGASSRLFIEVREKRGLCYYISTGREYYNDAGNMVTQAGVPVNKEKLNEALQSILHEHHRLAEGDVTEEELKRAKEILKGRMLISLEDSQNVASFYGMRKLLQNRLESPEKVIEKVEKVTSEQITALAKDIFTKDNLNIALIGPFEEKDVKILNT